MHCFTSCWRLVEGREDSLDLASRVSSILLELCELEVFLLSWPIGSGEISWNPKINAAEPDLIALCI